MSKYSVLHEKRREKQKLVRGEKSGVKRWQIGLAGRLGGLVLGISYVLVGVGVWGLLMIYGPVVKVEAVYQLRLVAQVINKDEGNWLGFLVPQFSFELIPSKIGDGWGIVIPKIFVKEKVVMNVDPTDKSEYMPALREGIAHAAGTSMPGDGDLGYYFAHSSGISGLNTGFNPQFFLLNKLSVGDEVRVYREGERFDYEVVSTEVMNADEVGFLDYDGDEERIVLQTCWPVGTSAKRLLVTAERVG